MANTYTWVIERMVCAPQLSGQTDVVITVYWRQNATNDTFNATVYSSIDLVYTPGTAFTPYDQLTQDQVVEWVKSALGADKCALLEASLDKQIANQANPPTVTLPLPWA